MSSAATTDPRRDALDYLILALAAAALSILALEYYYRHNAILLYGDAVAHINIARRVLDSRTPGIFQLGTVWLPLPHLLDIPFVLPDAWWRSGVGASVPSMLAYVAGCFGIFRLLRGRPEVGRLGSLPGLPGKPGVGLMGRSSRASAWTATLIYALNPNLLYMQATAMTESLYLALFIWTVVFFAGFVQTSDSEVAGKSLEYCAICLSAAMLVRYDAWFLAAFVFAGVVSVWGKQYFHHGDNHPTTRTSRVSGTPDTETRRTAGEGSEGSSRASEKSVHRGDAESRRKTEGGSLDSSSADSPVENVSASYEPSRS